MGTSSCKAACGIHCNHNERILPAYTNHLNLFLFLLFLLLLLLLLLLILILSIFLFSFFFPNILQRRENGFCSLPPIYYVNFNWMIIYLNRGSTLSLCARKLLFEQSKIFQANCSGMQMCILKSVKIFI